MVSLLCIDGAKLGTVSPEMSVCAEMLPAEDRLGPDSSVKTGGRFSHAEELKINPSISRHCSAKSVFRNSKTVSEDSVSLSNVSLPFIPLLWNQIRVFLGFFLEETCCAGLCCERRHQDLCTERLGKTFRRLRNLEGFSPQTAKRSEKEGRG